MKVARRYLLVEIYSISDNDEKIESEVNIVKKILIVNNNMNIGGVQKALVSLLHVLKDYYDVTLLLFCANGELMNEIPPEVRVTEVRGIFKYLGISQGECKSTKDKLVRGFLATIARIIGFKWSIKLMYILGRREEFAGYDVAISYLHCAMPKSFYGGVAEYVQYYVKAKKKICYVHCDYINSGTVTPYSKSIYMKYDTIIGVSKSVVAQFIKVVSQMREKTIAIYNPIDVQKIKSDAQKNPYEYNGHYVNCLTVARLSSEKGVDRFIRVLEKLNSDRIRYYVVGSGNEYQRIEALIHKKGLEGSVFLLGEKDNPYRFMINADMLVVPSYHEAAPVVFQEARVLGLPVFTTNTLSAKEMISDRYGIVVDNTEEAMVNGMRQIISGKKSMSEVRKNLECYQCGDDDVLGAIKMVLG